jgi:haloalkane dehalogenase
MIVMGHDWGSPIGLSVACTDPGRVSGLVLGNTFFWPADRRARMFSKIMSSRPLHRAILNRNLFVQGWACSVPGPWPAAWARTRVS